MSWLSAREAEARQHSPPKPTGSSVTLWGRRSSRHRLHSGPDGPASQRPVRAPPPGRGSLSLSRPRITVTQQAADPRGLGLSPPPAASKGRHPGVLRPGVPQQRRALTSWVPAALEPPLMAR
ncbi:hypothetical protein NDU88_005375 [Pleurodeles waltl]|uniref:Uncharacterized protein n=1 Tax=Pleurodeles waltl TaxID=8319 RepID=A0AAV7NQF4_PLEWA|nr:hypothetical protein NDU88_005375 [Pleurodeles waltl]